MFIKTLLSIFFGRLQFRLQGSDQYWDEAEYYVPNVQTNQVQKIELKKKALKQAFQKETENVNKFMSENNTGLNDAFLGELGTVVNSWCNSYSWY